MYNVPSNRKIKSIFIIIINNGYMPILDFEKSYSSQDHYKEAEDNQTEPFCIRTYAYALHTQKKKVIQCCGHWYHDRDFGKILIKYGFTIITISSYYTGIYVCIFYIIYLCLYCLSLESFLSYKGVKKIIKKIGIWWVWEIKLSIIHNLYTPDEVE